jgi:hypothetical protein
MIHTTDQSVSVSSGSEVLPREEIALETLRERTEQTREVLKSQAPAELLQAFDDGATELVVATSRRRRSTSASKHRGSRSRQQTAARSRSADCSKTARSS